MPQQPIFIIRMDWGRAIAEKLNNGLAHVRKDDERAHGQVPNTTTQN